MNFGVTMPQGKEETPFVKEFAPNSPLLKEMRKPQIKLIKHRVYGLKKMRRNKLIRR